MKSQTTIFKIITRNFKWIVFGILIRNLNIMFPIYSPCEFTCIKIGERPVLVWVREVKVSTHISSFHPFVSYLQLPCYFINFKEWLEVYNYYRCTRTSALRCIFTNAHWSTICPKKKKKPSEIALISIKKSLVKQTVEHTCNEKMRFTLICWFGKISNKTATIYLPLNTR